MNSLTQKDIDRLHRMEDVFGCKLLLPPCKKRLTPFLDVRSFRERGGDVSTVTSHLMYNGFSFFFNEDGFIEIVGSDTIFVREETNGKNYSGSWS